MGIPALYSYLKHTYKVGGLGLSTEVPKKIHRLFLDFNGIVHGAKEHVYKNHTNISDIETETLIIENVILYIQHMIDLIKPTELLYIAVDGVCPRAKMEQQRERRYKACQDRFFDAKVNNKPMAWDSNAISPGTTFMNFLNSELYKSTYLKQLSSKINVIISDSSVKGEGEQKIIKYMRKLDDDDDKINVIHGLDADLIMLSILQLPKTVYLFREQNNKQSFLSIPKFTNCLKSKHDYWDPVDYICLSFLMGNDFLPKHYSLNLRQNALTTVLNSYDLLRKSLQRNLVKNGIIDKEFLISLFKIFAKEEDTLVKERAEHMVYKRCIRHGNSRDDKITYWPDYHRNAEVIINFGEEGWRLRYYNYLKSLQNISIQDMCKQYVNGLAWNLKYYTCNDPTQDCDQGWYYPYLHAPLFKDLVLYLETNDIELPITNKRYTSLEQLAIVLPPYSNKLLPFSWRKYIWEKDTHFPKKFKLDPIGCIFKWECPPILNHFDEHKIFTDLNKFKLTNLDKLRQKTHEDYLVQEK
tara:strand:- start:15998 stop:17572 length:1575 start_codon:yes stop_codon:yes gene_type:complete